MRGRRTFLADGNFFSAQQIPLAMCPRTFLRREQKPWNKLVWRHINNVGGNQREPTETQLSQQQG
jgi:hypothetical protein